MKLTAPLFAGIAAAVLLFGATPAQSQVIYSSGHGDIGIDFDEHDDTSFHVHWNIPGGRFMPEEVAALFSTTSTDTAAPVLNALGNPTGTVYRAGSGSYQPNLGFGGHLHTHDGFVNDEIILSLVSVSGAGSFVMEHHGTIYMSSFDESLSENNNQYSFWIEPGDADIHEHFAWYFSQEGRYDITFQWQGVLAETGETITGKGTFTMYAGSIPEPGTWALILSSASSLVAFRRWRRAYRTP